jgi:hypothetical protein
MIYNETYIGTARDVEDLIVLLRNEVPMNATVDVASYEHKADVEVWQIFINGKWIVGTDTLDSKYMDMTITEFDFSADAAGRITCTVDLK